MTLFFIKNSSTYCYLNVKGGWNRSIGTYGLKSFNTKEEALAAVPANVECYIDSFTPVKKELNPNEEFVLISKGKVLNKSGVFSIMDKRDDSAFRFAKEEDALDKALALDLDMDATYADSVKKVKKKD